MDPKSLDERLSRMATAWSLVLHAHGGPGDAEAAAQRAFIERYQRVVYRYLLGAVRDPEAADELFQEFALRFVRGGFRRADPARGRFRDFLKTSLVHLISDYRKRRYTRVQSLDSHLAEPAAPDSTPDEPDQEFTDSWRQELLTRAWAALEEHQRVHGQPFYSVLRFRSENPDMPSGEMAGQLTRQLSPDTPFTDAGIRKTLQRAREKFADLLLDEVAESLDQPTLDQLEEELIELRLQTYCRSALERRRDRT